MIEYKKLNIVGKLIYINVAVYIVTQLYRLFLTLFCVSGFQWQDYLALHSNINYFLLTPWTVFTYFFTHADLGIDLFHIVFNMLWLWWFGNYFLRYRINRQFLSVYLLGGIFSGLFFLLVYNIFPYFLLERNYVTLVGASGAIFAVIVATAMRSPDDMLYLNFFVKVVPVRMKWIAVAAIVINLLSLPNSYNTGGIVCHIGGAIFGFLYSFYEMKGINIARWFEMFCDKLVNIFKPRPRMKVSRGGARTVNADKRKDMDYNTQQKEYQTKIDAILDKISKSGYDGLTAEEKQLLFDASHRRKK